MTNVSPYPLRQGAIFRAVLLISMLALVLSATGCGLFKDPPAGPSQNVNVNVNVGTPAPSPSPAASPSPKSTSDVHHMTIFNDVKCSAGNPFVLEAGCAEARVTATPKKADGTDATNHSDEITWTANGLPSPNTTGCVPAGAALVCGDPANPKFNRWVKRDGASTGSVILVASIREPHGLFTDDATFTVQ